MNDRSKGVGGLELVEEGEAKLGLRIFNERSMIRRTEKGPKA